MRQKLKLVAVVAAITMATASLTSPMRAKPLRQAHQRSPSISRRACCWRTVRAALHNGACGISDPISEQ